MASSRTTTISRSWRHLATLLLLPRLGGRSPLPEPQRALRLRLPPRPQRRPRRDVLAVGRARACARARAGAGPGGRRGAGPGLPQVLRRRRRLLRQVQGRDLRPLDRSKVGGGTVGTKFKPPDQYIDAATKSHTHTHTHTHTPMASQPISLA